MPLSFFLFANLNGLDYSSFQLTPASLLGWIGTNAAVGFFEEALFRGLVLFIFLEAWGKTRHGLMAACIVQALLFGSFHILNLLGGELPLSVLSNAVFAIIIGVAFGAAYTYSGSLWTCIVFHTLINMSGNANEALSAIDIANTNFSLSSFVPSLLMAVFVSLMPSLWFAYKSDLRYGLKTSF